MAETKTLHDLFIDELRDIYDAEKQLTKALPKMAKAASSSELRTAFENHLKETQGHIERLEQAFESLDERVSGKHCDGIAGIIEEGKSVMDEECDEVTMDAALIGAGGLGEPIISGLNLNDHVTILEGAVPAAVLALLVQWCFDLLDRVLIPKGLRL